MKHFSLFTKFVLALGLSTVCLSPANAMQELKAQVEKIHDGKNDGEIESFRQALKTCTDVIAQAMVMLQAGKTSVNDVETLVKRCFYCLEIKCGWIKLNRTIPDNIHRQCLSLLEAFKKEQLDWLKAAVEKLQPQILPEVVAVANKGIVRGLATKIVSLVTKYPTLSSTVAVAACAYLGLSYGVQFIPVK